MPDAILKAVGLTRSATPGGRLLLDAVNFDVSLGRCAAVVGPSGSGKTLLLRALAWLDPLDAGEVFFNGRQPREIGMPEFRRHVMYLHQSPWLPEGTVDEALRQPFELIGFTGSENSIVGPEQIASWLEALDRKRSFLQQPTRELSGGERQIVALLRAMQLAPDVLLLDEPMSALDAKSQQAGEKFILQWLNDSPSRAIVLVTHDRHQAERMSQRVLNMNEGQLEEA